MIHDQEKKKEQPGLTCTCATPRVVVRRKKRCDFPQCTGQQPILRLWGVGYAKRVEQTDTGILSTTRPRPSVRPWNHRLKMSPRLAGWMDGCRENLLLPTIAISRGKILYLSAHSGRSTNPVRQFTSQPGPPPPVVRHQTSANAGTVRPVLNLHLRGEDHGMVGYYFGATAPDLLIATSVHATEIEPTNKVVDPNTGEYIFGAGSGIFMP